MKLHELKPPVGAKRTAKRFGRGLGSGKGEFSGRGRKGQKARAGGRVRPGFEGGQLPLIKRLPAKHGFTNPFKKEFQLVNVGLLSERFQAGATISESVLQAMGIVRRNIPVKVLGTGDVNKALTVNVTAFSESAKAKIEAAGGKAVKA